jgi:hypothetical protein
MQLLATKKPGLNPLNAAPWGLTQLEKNHERVMKGQTEQMVAMKQ